MGDDRERSYSSICIFNYVTDHENKTNNNSSVSNGDSNYFHFTNLTAITLKHQCILK